MIKSADVNSVFSLPPDQVDPVAQAPHRNYPSDIGAASAAQTYTE